jgi:hypothetical protein
MMFSKNTFPDILHLLNLYKHYIQVLKNDEILQKPGAWYYGTNSESAK